MPWIDVTSCAKVIPQHPCDPPLPCDPKVKPPGRCPNFLCLEKIKNPPYCGEQKRCLGHPKIDVRSCDKPVPPHPCDTDPYPCCVIRKGGNCTDPALCLEKIKNLKKTVGPYCPMRNDVPGE